MLISLNWLKNYVGLSSSITPNEVSSRLNSSTVEVEKIIKVGENLDKVVVGKILSVDKHSNADKLKLCKVDVGSEKVQIVCGGSNLEVGMLVAVAKVGAKVQWHGEGELVELKPTKIRGEKSDGMICASSEIGLESLFPLKDKTEILDLSKFKIKIGQTMDEALELNDYILEIDNKSLSHRPDLWGHYGLAREVAVLFDKEVKDYKTKKIKKGKDNFLKVEVVDSKKCSRYTAIVIKNIKVKESPDWLKQKLSFLGIKSINNIVDITNYVMLDLGQPMHAFDADAVSLDFKNKDKKNIIVRQAKSGESLKCLDDKEYKLDEDVLVIADSQKPLAVAGIIGGFESSVKNGTKTIILESANFDASNIRKTSTKFGVRTESAVRFEKSLDPNLCELALRKAVELILDICPDSKVVGDVQDEKDFVLKTGPIELSLVDLQNKLGLEISEKEVFNILKKLGFVVKTKSKQVFSVTIPTWRATKDIIITEDLIEEVARIYGFNNLPVLAPSFILTNPITNHLQKISRKTLDIMVKELGYTEVQNYSFVSREQIENLGDDVSKYIELDNPLSKERPFLRRHLVLNILDNLKQGLEYYSEIKTVEIGSVYIKEEAGPRTSLNGGELLPKQDTWLVGAISNKNNDIPFWEAKKTLERISKRLNIKIELAHYQKISSWKHNGRSAIIVLNGQDVGSLYELHPATRKAYGLDNRVAIIELNLNNLLENTIDTKFEYTPVPIYPEVERDLAFVVSENVSHNEVLSVLKPTSKFLKSVNLFDVYVGDSLEKGMKSLAYKLIYYSSEGTLKTEDIDKATDQAIKNLEKKLGAKIRK